MLIMFTKKIITSLLIFFLLFSSVSAYIIEEKQKIDFEENTIVYNAFDASIRKIPTLFVNKFDTIKSWTKGVILKSVKREWNSWVKVQYETGETGWVIERLLIQEKYYSIGTEEKTIFFREIISLSWVEKEYCVSSTPQTIETITSSFCPEARVYEYTPLESSSSETEESSSYSLESITSSFRPEARVYEYTPLESSSSETEESSSYSVENVTSSFRTVPLVYEYTPVESSSSENEESSSYSVEVATTSFRPNPHVFKYVVEEGIEWETSEAVDNFVEYITNSFRPDDYIYEYSPKELEYDCISVE